MDDPVDPAMRLLERHLSGELPRDELLAGLADGDPRLGMVARLFARESQVDVADDAPSESDLQLERATAMAEEARGLAEDVRREFDGVVSEIADLQDRLAVLATALGACSACWGENDDCRWCRGRGSPGAMAPDRAAFTHWVLPAVQLMSGAERHDGRDGRNGSHGRRTA